MGKIISVVIILCLLFDSCVSTYTSTSTLKETQLHKSSGQFTHLLIVGVGSTTSRMFLEDLSSQLIRQFSEFKIKCEFTYAGKIPRGTLVDLATLKSPAYDGYLLLNPIDTSYIDLNKDVSINPFRSSPDVYRTNGIMTGNQYLEDYYVELYSANDTTNQLWEAELKLDVDVAKANIYPKIAKTIVYKCVQNGFINPK